MKCRKHGVEMEERQTTIGWGSVSELVCPECEEENSGYGFGSSSRVLPFLRDEARRQ